MYQQQQQHPDDESILSGMYTDSGDASVGVVNTTLDTEEDDDEEAFRRAVQAEQVRVMMEFGISTPTIGHSETPMVDAAATTPMYADSYNNSIQQSDTDDPWIDKKSSSTPETYDEAYGHFNDDNEDASTFQPYTLFLSSDAYNPRMLTPRRVRFAIALLCLILIMSSVVAMASFLAQKNNETQSMPQQSPDRSDLPRPDRDPPSESASSPAASPTMIPMNWTNSTTACMDHPNRTFFVNDTTEKQNCTFLKHHAAQRARLCLPENAGYQWCPVSCGLCLKDVAVPVVPSPVIVVTQAPEMLPSMAPVMMPPSSSPTVLRTTVRPTATPTMSPTTSRPTSMPTVRPTSRPTVRPTTMAPTSKPPTVRPTMPPTTIDPTLAPTAMATTTEEPSFLCSACPLWICRVIPC